MWATLNHMSNVVIEYDEIAPEIMFCKVCLHGPLYPHVRCWVELLGYNFVIPKTTLNMIFSV